MIHARCFISRRSISQKSLIDSWEYRLCPNPTFPRPSSPALLLSSFPHVTFLVKKNVKFFFDFPSCFETLCPSPPCGSRWRCGLPIYFPPFLVATGDFSNRNFRPPKWNMGPSSFPRGRSCFFTRSLLRLPIAPGVCVLSFLFPFVPWLGFRESKIKLLFFSPSFPNSLPPSSIVDFFYPLRLEPSWRMFLDHNALGRCAPVFLFSLTYGCPRSLSFPRGPHGFFFPKFLLESSLRRSHFNRSPQKVQTIPLNAR